MDGLKLNRIAGDGSMKGSIRPKNSLGLPRLVSQGVFDLLEHGPESTLTPIPSLGTEPDFIREGRNSIDTIRNFESPPQMHEYRSSERAPRESVKWAMIRNRRRNCSHASDDKKFRPKLSEKSMFPSASIDNSQGAQAMQCEGSSSKTPRTDPGASGYNANNNASPAVTLADSPAIESSLQGQSPVPSPASPSAKSSGA